MRSISAVVVATLVTTTVAPAAADYPIDLGALGFGALANINQTRRAIAVGPHVGYFGGADLDGNGMRGVSFGIALYTFKIPTLFDLKERLTEEITKAVDARIAEIRASGGTVPTDLSPIVNEVGTKIIDDMLGAGRKPRVKPRTLEKPSLKVVLEGAVLQQPGGVQVRLGASKGLGPVSLGVTGALQRYEGTTTPIIGPELSVHLTPIGQAWTPVFDVYVRADFAFASEQTSSFVLIGGRVLLDLL